MTGDESAADGGQDGQGRGDQPDQGVRVPEWRRRREAAIARERAARIAWYGRRHHCSDAVLGEGRKQA